MHTGGGGPGCQKNIYFSVLLVTGVRDIFRTLGAGMTNSNANKLIGCQHVILHSEQAELEYLKVVFEASTILFEASMYSKLRHK